MITRIRMSAMPTAPMRRRITTRNIRNRKRYMAVPRMMSSHGDTLSPKISPQSTLIDRDAAFVAVDRAVGAGALQPRRIELDAVRRHAHAVTPPPLEHQQRLAVLEVQVARLQEGLRFVDRVIDTREGHRLRASQ